MRRRVDLIDRHVVGDLPFFLPGQRAIVPLLLDIDLVFTKPSIMRSC